ncbi:MAG: tail fiber domain-containing protein [Flavobacteriales bacterium]|nr:tail fiber domain-containing protein [Flavobacteriales bacterium]
MKLLKRHLIITLSTVLCSFSAMAQVPQAVNYQAVARDAGGNLLANTAIGIQFSIHDITSSGTVLYQEQHTTTTNELGLFTLQIGSGAPSIGDFASTYWLVDDKFLEVEMDVNGGTSYSSMGTSQLVSVPYSLLAQTAATIGPNATLEPTQLTSGSANIGDILVWDGSNWLPNPPADPSSTNEIQTLSVSGSSISLSNGGGVIGIPNSWISVGGSHILNPNAGNVSIDPLGSNIPTASLDVRRGNAADGTAAFRGTTHDSHFNYGTSEDTYIRGGKNDAPVYINDTHNGNVNVVTGGGGLGIGVSSNLSYKAQLVSTIGKGMRIDVTGSASIPEGLAVLMSGVSSADKYGIYSESNGLGSGNNWGVFGRASGAAPGYKVGVLGEAAGTGNFTNNSIGVQGKAISQSTDNFGVYGYATTPTTYFNYGVFGEATGNLTDVPFTWDDHLQGGFGISKYGNFAVYGSTQGSNGSWAGYFDGDVYTWDTYYRSSDSRLKNNVKTLESGLATVARLRPVSYNLKESAKEDAKFSEKRTYGFIAQEVGEVLPELVVSFIHPVDVNVHGDERQLLALNYDGFIPVLTSAIQEQQAIIAKLKTDNENLSSQLQAQALKMDELAKQVQALSKTVSKINNH